MRNRLIFLVLGALLCLVIGARSKEFLSSVFFKSLQNGEVIHPTENMFSEFLSLNSKIERNSLSGLNFHILRDSFLKSAHTWVSSFLYSQKSSLRSGNEYPYFRWLPIYIGAAIPGSTSVKFSSPCFKQVSVSSSLNSNGTYDLVVDLQQKQQLLCEDFYLFATTSAFVFQSFSAKTTKTIVFSLPENARPAETWDANTNGIRVFRFVDGVAKTLADLLATLELFEPFFSQQISEKAKQANLEFMRDYANVKMNTRSIRDVDIDESLIASGDFIGVVRLDGIDPMLAWAMGSTTGHTVVALWIDRVLHFCESTTEDGYWPTNGIQCTEYKQWLELARKAEMQVVWAPLSQEYRRRFNETAAIEFFKSTKGLDYGYRNILFGWLDTPHNNYPCVPPYPSQQCMTWEFVQILFGAMDRFAPAIGDLLFRQALNSRLGTSGLLFPEILQAASQQMNDTSLLVTLPEQDSWVYNTTRDGQPAVGKSQVCCVFVCNIWKAGGLFKDINDELNCAELTNLDDYRLKFFESDMNSRPSQCQAADPENPVCQLMGEFELKLNQFNSHALYPHYAEKCPSQAPDYIQPEQC